jgi:hypothetical protein
MPSAGGALCTASPSLSGAQTILNLNDFNEDVKGFELVGHAEFEVVLLRVAIKPFCNKLLYVRDQLQVC